MEKERVNKRKEKKDKTNYSIKVYCALHFNQKYKSEQLHAIIMCIYLFCLRTYKLQIVVRHLPPTMTEQEFLEQVDPLPENDYYHYCNADWSLGQDATCRAYIDMSLKDLAEVVQFRDRFDGYVFVDSKGGEYVAIVEYAPFQCFMKNKARNKDNKVDTIEKESHFQEFVRKYTEERDESNRLNDLKLDFNFDSRSDEVKSTPLLQYLANKKEKRREEARRRNEEKRKQREEQKLLQIAKPSENSKAKQSNNETKKSNSNSKTESKEGQKSEEVTKNSRSKRRTERDQRRREQHEQRKMTRDREIRDKKNESNEKHEANTDMKSQKERNQSHSDQNIKKDVAILKKEIEMPSTNSNNLNDEPKDVDILRSKESSESANISLISNSQTRQEAYKAQSSRSTEENRIRNKV